MSDTYRIKREWYLKGYEAGLNNNIDTLESMGALPQDVIDKMRLEVKVIMANIKGAYV